MHRDTNLSLMAAKCHQEMLKTGSDKTGKGHFFHDLYFERLPQRFERGKQNNPDIHSGAGMLYIIEIPLQALVNRTNIWCGAAEAIDLRKARNTGGYKIPVVISRKQIRKILGVSQHMRPGTD